MRQAKVSSEESQVTTVEGVGQELVQYVYRELRRLAQVKLRRWPHRGSTLQATELVNEAYVRLNRDPDRVWKGRRHFYRAAALAMRHILIDRARARVAMKNGGGWQRTDISLNFPDGEGARALSWGNIIALDAALARMQRHYPEAVEIVLMRCYCGLTVSETAELLAISRRSVDRKWRFAKAWLRRELE